MINDKITILIPANNSISTIKNTLDSIFILNPNLINELIYIDDNSKDGSLEFVKDYLLKKCKKYKYLVIENKIPSGLAANYNYGIKNSKSRYLLTIHQDIEFTDKKALEKTIKTFNQDDECVLVNAIVLHPKSLLKKYNFWMKVHYIRVIYREASIMSAGGKFDCYDLKRLNFLFDSKTFKYSGEDIDFQMNMRKFGKRSICSGVKVIHNHNLDPNYSYKSYIKKENQFNETYGVVLRKWLLFGDIKAYVLFFHRLILVTGLFISYLNLLTIFLIIFYIFYYSLPVFKLEYKNPKILLVPFVNLFILISGACWNVIGFIKGRQRI